MSNDNSTDTTTWRKQKLIEEVRGLLHDGGSQRYINSIMQLLNNYLLLCSQIESVAKDNESVRKSGIADYLPDMSDLNLYTSTITQLTEFLLEIEEIGRGLQCDQ